MQELQKYHQLTLRFETYNSGWLDSISGEIFVEREYEHPGVKILPGDVVLDLGGNIGIFASYALGMGASRVYTVEPYPSYLELLAKNMWQFGELVQILPYCVTNENKMGHLHVNFEQNTIYDEVFKERKWSMENSPQPPVPVECIRLDSLLKRHKIERVDFLKMDIEGSEYFLFRDIEPKLLQEKISRIVIEYHWSYNSEHLEIIQKLQDCGYNVTDLPVFEKAKVGKIFASNPRLPLNAKILADLEAQKLRVLQK